MKNFWIMAIVLLAIALAGYGSYRVMQGPVGQQGTMQATKMQANAVYKMTAKDKLGNVMTDIKGMTLYTYANDTTGSSTCSGKCQGNWPPYGTQSQTGNLPANITIIKRTDGTMQYAWKTMPLYYFTKDKDSGDAYGNGVGGVWSVVK